MHSLRRQNLIGIDKSPAQLVELFKRGDRNIFAVTDSKERFAGIVELNDIKQKLFQPEIYHTILVKSVMKKPAAVLGEDDNMLTVMEKFDTSQIWCLPVLKKERKFPGFISKTKVFHKYRQILSEQGEAQGLEFGDALGKSAPVTNKE